MKAISSILGIGTAILLYQQCGVCEKCVRIEQIGPGNTATSIQTGVDNNIESIQETGGTNFLDAEQVGNNHKGSGLNDADIVQLLGSNELGATN